MKKNYFYMTVLFMLILFMFPILSLAQQELFGSNGNGSPINPGGLVLISQFNGGGVFIGDPVTPGGVNGIDFDSTGRLFGSTIQGNGTASTLVEINPISGGLINTIGDIVDSTGAPLSMGDLAMQPGTDVLFAISSNNVSTGGILYTIDTTTAVATLVGVVINRACGLAFAPDGTLYCWEGDGDGVHILNPNNGDIIGNIAENPESPFIDAAAVRADGILFGSCGGSVCDDADSIFTLDPATGVVTFIGLTGQGRVSDLAFGNLELTRPIPTLSEWGLIAMAGILGIIGFMVLRRRKAAV